MKMEFEMTNEILLNSTKEAIANLDVEKVEIIKVTGAGNRIRFEFVLTERDGSDYRLETGDKMSVTNPFTKTRLISPMREGWDY